MTRSQQPALTLFAVGMIGLGILALVYGDFALVWRGCPTFRAFEKWASQRPAPQWFRFQRHKNYKHVTIGNLCQSCYGGTAFTSMERAAAMPTRNVNLTNDLDHFVAAKVKSGRYENASEVVRAGLRTLEREEQQYKAKLAALRAAIDQGDASGIARGNVFGRVRKAIKLPVSR